MQLLISSLNQLVFESQNMDKELKLNHSPATTGGSTETRPPVPFVWKTYEMVEDPKTDQIISWTKDSKSFIVWDEHEFSSKLLPRYFRHSNFSSFTNQLSFYGFRKDTGSCLWKFSNPGFQRGNKQMLTTIRSKVKTSRPKSVDGEPAIDMLRLKLVELEERVEHVKKLVDAREALMKARAMVIARRILEKRKRMRRKKRRRVSKRLTNERKEEEEEEEKKDQPLDTEISYVDYAWLEEEGDAKAWLSVKEWIGFEEEKMPVDVDPRV